MPKSKKSAALNATKFVDGLKNLFDALPTKDQQKEATIAINEIIAFLSNLRDKFINLPSQEDTENIRQSMSKLNELFSQSENNAVIKHVIIFGQEPKNLNSKSGSTKSKDIKEIDVADLVNSINHMPSDEIKTQLKIERSATIRAVAIALGLKPKSKEVKTVLIDRIVKKIENAAMDERLAGQTESEWSITDQAVAK